MFLLLAAESPDGPWVWISGALAAAVTALWIAYSKVQEARVTFATDEATKNTATVKETATVLANQAEQTRLMGARVDTLLARQTSFDKSLAIIVERIPVPKP